MVKAAKSIQPLSRHDLIVAGAAHRHAAQAIAADLARGPKREIEHPAAGERAAILHRAFDLLAVVEIGDDEDGAERLGPVRAGNFIRLEALAARVPGVFPIDRGFLIVGGWTGDATHPHLLKAVGLRGQCAQQQRKRGQPQLRGMPMSGTARDSHDAASTASALGALERCADLGDRPVAILAQFPGSLLLRAKLVDARRRIFAIDVKSVLG
jgi:hypothetical protein